MRFVARAEGAPDLRRRAQPARRAQRAERARRDRHRPRVPASPIRRSRRRSPSSAAWAAASSATASFAADGGGTFTLIDDYGHHPTEMAATIAAARGSFPGRRLVLAFQPHRYTRTRDLFEDFVQVLSTADALVLTDVYPAGEPPIVAADGRALARAVRVAGKVEPVFVESVAELPDALRALVRDGDVVVTMGAGSIGQTPQLLARGGRMMMNEPQTFTMLRGKLGARRPARPLHELALRRARRSRLRAGGSRRPRRVRPPAAARRAADGHRARQQPAGARRRHPRHGRDPLTPRSTCSRSPTA